MILGASAWHGVGPIMRINGKTDNYQYLSILKNEIKSFVFNSMPLNWTLMQDNDLKHTARLTQDCLKKENICVLDLPAQSPHLSPLENL